MCLFAIRKVSQQKTLSGQRKTLSCKKNLAWFSGKCFPFILGGKNSLEVVKNLKISYYLLIMSNLVLKLLITIYFVRIFFLSISSLKMWFNLIFILTLVLIFMIVIYFSLIIFLIEIFYLLNLILILLIVTYFI
jgi:hypothetical protein